MPVVSHDGLGFSSLAWTFKLLPSNYTETSIWHARPFVSTFYRPAHGLAAWLRLIAPLQVLITLYTTIKCV